MVALGIAFFLLAQSQSNQTRTSSLQRRLDTLVQDYKRSHPEIPAMYAFIARDGALRACSAQGFTDEKRTIPARIDDQLRIGSNSKTITATLVAKLIDDGVIKWETTVAEAFPRLAVTFPRSKVLKATVWQLLCHHGGVKSVNVFDPVLAGLNGSQWREKCVELSVADTSNPGPGDQNIYGPGPDVVMAMAEKMSGHSFEELFAQHLGDQLEIKSLAMGRGARTPIDWQWKETEGTLKPAPLDANAYLKNGVSGGICLSMLDMMKIHSLRAGVSLRTQGKFTRLSEKNRTLLNTAPWASQDGAAMGAWYVTDVGYKWLEHAGNTGCGDWSRISILREGTTVCFFHVTYNRPGDDPRPALEFKDFSTNLRQMSVGITD